MEKRPRFLVISRSENKKDDRRFVLMPCWDDYDGLSDNVPLMMPSIYYYYGGKKHNDPTQHRCIGTELHRGIVDSDHPGPRCAKIRRGSDSLISKPRVNDTFLMFLIQAHRGNLQRSISSF